MGKSVLETLATCLEDRSSADSLSQQQFKPLVIAVAKLSFTVLVKKLLLVS